MNGTSSCNPVISICRVFLLKGKMQQANQYRRFFRRGQTTEEGNERRKDTSRVLSACDSKETLVLPRAFPLPDTHENSNYILLKIPIEISNNAHGEKAISAAEVPLSSILQLSPGAIARLQDARLIRLPRSVRGRNRQSTTWNFSRHTGGSSLMTASSARLILPVTWVSAGSGLARR